MGNNIKLQDLDLSLEEERDIIEFIARKRNIKNYKRKSTNKLLQTIKENKGNQKQSKNKKRIDDIRDGLKDLSYKLSKSELKEIKKNLYNIEKRTQLNSKRNNKYRDELDKKILKLDGYHQDYDDSEYRRIKDLRDLFKLSIHEDYYKPKLAKSGYNNNYTQCESKGDKILTLEEYLALIEQYLRELIDYYKNKGEWKVQFIADINFISLKPGSDETRVMYTESDNIEIRIGDDINDVIKELFKSLLKRYQENLQEKTRGSEFGFDGVNLFYYDFNKISLNRGGSYIEPAKWIKDKRSIINPKNNDYKSFQYAITVALNRDKINRDPQRISKIKSFIEQYSWNGIEVPATSKDWKKFEQNNESIALNVLYVHHGTKNISLAYKSKHNLNREEQVILLMISNGEKWHYTAVTRLSGLLRGVTSINNGDFYFLNCFHVFRTKNEFEEHKKMCEKHEYCHLEMPTKDNNIIKYNQGEKSIN